MKKKCLLSLFLIVLLTVLMTLSVSAATVLSGSCGDNLTYTLDDLGTLTISGTGRMYYYGYSSPPWYSQKSSIKKVVISDGVTSIGNSAFSSCTSLTSIDIPA